MAHGSYDSAPAHGPWVIQHYTTPWIMGCMTVYTVHSPHDSWVIRHYTASWPMGCTTVDWPHETWVVQQFTLYTHTMDHGLYNGKFTPWIMDRTTVGIPHGSWAVRW